MKNPDDNLELSQLKNIKNNLPLLRENEILSILSQVDNVPTKNVFNSNYKLIVYSIVGTFAVLALMWFTYKNTNENSKINSITSSSFKLNDVIIDSKVETNSSKFTPTIELKTYQKGKEKINILSVNNTSNQASKHCLIYFATIKEMEDLGIKYDGNKFNFLTQSYSFPENIWTIEKLKNKGYPNLKDTFIYNESNEIGFTSDYKSDIMPFKIHNENINKLCPISLYSFQYTGSGSRVSSSSFGYCPLITSNSAKEVYYELRILNKAVYNTLIKSPITESIVLCSDSAENISNLLHFIVKDPNGKSIVRLTFVPSEEILSKLNPKMKAFFAEIPSTEIFQNTYKSKNVPKEENQTDKITDNIFENCLNPLLLNENELSKLGLNLENGNIKFKTVHTIETKCAPKDYILREGIDTNFEIAYQIMNNSISMNSVEDKRKSNFSNEFSYKFIYNCCTNLISPIVATSRVLKFDGNYYRKNGSSSFISVGKQNKVEYILGNPLLKDLVPNENSNISSGKLSLANTLIPVKFTIGDSSKKVLDAEYSEVILWFLPNKEFLENIPIRYQQLLSKELEAAHCYENDNITLEEACNYAETGNKSIIGLCGTSTTNISKSRLYPNPAISEINCSSEIPHGLKYNIDIYDPLGNLVKSAISGVSKGLINEKIDISQLQSGLYLLIITLENKEKVTLRFIK